MLKIKLFIYTLILALFFHSTNYAQNILTPNGLNKDAIPKSIIYEGTFKKAFIWEDKQGKHIALITELKSYITHKSEEMGDAKTAKLFAYSFLLKDGVYIKEWTVNDFIKDCYFDMQVQFFENAFQITDLNKNGVAEIWMQYKLGCTSDVSPLEMKIIMYEGNKKYAIRGTNKVKTGVTENGKPIFEGGYYTLDNQFTNAPTVFIDFAKKIWNKNIMQKW